MVPRRRFSGCNIAPLRTVFNSQSHSSGRRSDHDCNPDYPLAVRWSRTRKRTQLVAFPHHCLHCLRDNLFLFMENGNDAPLTMGDFKSLSLELDPALHSSGMLGHDPAY